MIGLVLMMVWGPAVKADLFEYKDGQGVRSFTDDFSDIAPEERDNFKALPEIKSGYQPPPPVPTNRKSGRRKSPVTPASVVKAGLPENPGDEALAKEALELEKLKVTLKKEYNRLKSEKQRLTDLSDELKRADTVNEKTLENFRGQVKQLNRETQIYERRLMGFMERVSAYNREID